MRTLSLVGLMVLLLCPSALRAQFVYGTTGLLHMPTGEMQRDKTFMFGCAFLDTEATPGHWSYDTGNYFRQLYTILHNKIRVQPLLLLLWLQIY